MEYYLINDKRFISQFKEVFKNTILFVKYEVNEDDELEQMIDFVNGEYDKFTNDELFDIFESYKRRLFEDNLISSLSLNTLFLGDDDFRYLEELERSYIIENSLFL